MEFFSSNYVYSICNKKFNEANINMKTNETKHYILIYFITIEMYQ